MPLLPALALLFAGTPQGPAPAATGETPDGGARVFTSLLDGRPGGAPRLQTWFRDEPLARTKLSPKLFGPTKEPFPFDYLVAGFVQPPKAATGEDRWELRFRVYNQMKPKPGDETFSAARMLLRLWETAETWGYDHPETIPGQAVDVYLCWGGEPGGEQLIDHDPQIPKGFSDRVNTIYIYDLPSFRGPVERAREIAHEYGHAVLPAVGGYTAPEYWGNGVLGERLFLSALARDVKTGVVPARDLFDLDPKDLDVWLAKNVAPARTRAALNGPFSAALSAKDKSGMDAFVGLATYLQAILPPKTFGRALKLMATGTPSALAKSAPLAAAETRELRLTFPPELLNRPVFIPIATAPIPGVKILSRKNGWTKIVSPRPEITVRTTP